MTKCLLACGTMILLATAVSCGGLRSSSTPPSARVDGVVVDADGEPAADVTVAIGEAVVTTDIDGRFSFDGIGAHYDATLALKNTQSAYVFQEMTTRAPTLRIFDVALSARSHEAHVRAELPADMPPTTRVVVVAEAADASARVVDVHPTETQDGIDVALRWIGDASTRVTLRAIAYEADAATLAPTRYVGLATLADEPIGDGGTSAWRVSYEPVRETTLDARVAAPPAHAVEWTSLFIDFGHGGHVAKLADRLAPDANVRFVVPDVPGATFSVSAFARAGEGLASVASDRAGAGAGYVSLDLPTVPLLRAPARGAVVLPDAEFAWQPLDAARAIAAADVSWVYFGAEDQSDKSAPHVWLATPESKTTLPDLRPLGIDLTKTPRGVWYVVAAPSATTVEEAAESGLFRDGAGAGGNTAPWKYAVDGS